MDLVIENCGNIKLEWRPKDAKHELLYERDKIMRKILPLAILLFATVASAQKKDIAPSFQIVSIPDGHVAIQAPGNSVNPACPGSATAPHCVTLTWTAPVAFSDGSAFPAGSMLTHDVSRATFANGVTGTFTQLTTTPLTVAAYEDDNVVAGQTYIYEAVSHLVLNSAVVSTSAASAPSNQNVIPFPPLNPPSAPLGIPH